MTEIQIAGIAIYLVIGYLIADTFIVKINNSYWLTLFFYPIMIAVFFVTLLLLMVALKIWELKGWVVDDNSGNWS
jgi:O-antigen/teichoic acid export membrane protein